MSSPGGSFANILPLIAPDLYAKQLGIQQRMQLGQALLGGTAGPIGNSPYGGVRNAGNAILGAMLTKRAMKEMSALYSPQGDAPQAQGQQQSDTLPQYDENTAQTMAARYGMTPGQVFGTSPQVSTAQDTSGAATGGGQSMPQSQGNGMGGGMVGSAVGARSIPQAMSAAIPTVPGWSQQQSQMAFITSPSAYWAAMAPTPEFKNALSIAGGNPEMAKQLLFAKAQKDATINLRPGGGALNFMNNSITTMPTSEGVQTTFPQGAGGPAQMNMVSGAAQAIAQSKFAEQLPGAILNQNKGYSWQKGPDGRWAYTPQFQSQADTAGVGDLARSLIAGINPQATSQVESGGNPYAVSPRGAVGPMQTMPGTLTNPGYGVQPAQNPANPQDQARVGSDYLAAMMDHYKNPVVAHVAYNMGPGATDAWLAKGGRFQDLPDETQKYLGRIAVSQALPQQRPQTGPVMPELPPGQSEYISKTAAGAGERVNDIVDQARESPMRINVLDNIIGLSESGVATGPSQDWQNKILGVAANAPGLSAVMGGAKDNVAKFQMLKKFMSQNALRNWQAAGGTGTNQQLETMEHANPNDALFPKALQEIAKWGKASELAIQGKANAQDQYLTRFGSTPTAQQDFERQWRNSFDPKAYQYQLMSPAEKQDFIKTVVKTPQAARDLMNKIAQIKALGGLPGGGQ